MDIRQENRYYGEFFAVHKSSAAYGYKKEGVKGFYTHENLG